MGNGKRFASNFASLLQNVCMVHFVHTLSEQETAENVFFLDTAARGGHVLQIYT